MGVPSLPRAPHAAQLFFEAAKGTSDRVGKGVHLLMANVQLQMCGIELMHLATSMNGSPVR